MPAKTAKNSKSSKKAVKTAEVVVQLPAVQLPAAQNVAQLSATSKVKEQPMWNGKPISAAGLVYHQRQEAHVCVKCGKPLAEGSNLLCTAHLEYHNKWHGARKARIAEAMALLAKQETAPVAQQTVVAAVEAAAQPKAALKPTAKKQPTKKSSKK